MPSPRPVGLHHSPLLPTPFRLVSITKCFPNKSAETLPPYAELSSLPMKFDTFNENPSAAATFAAFRRSAITAAECHRECPPSRYTNVVGFVLNTRIASANNDTRDRKSVV